MKNYMILLAVLFTSLVSANDVTPTRTRNLETTRYGYAQPLKFVERGVEFFIFPNGEFDFNTHPRNYRSNYRRRSVHINTTYGAPRGYTHNRGVRVEHDHLGRVRRIGSVFINYDHHGRIKRIGSVYMNYHRRLLSNIGGLHIFYDRYNRIIRTSGRIKHNMECHFCGAANCNINHYNHNDGGHDNDDWGYEDDDYNDDDMYYYKSNKNKKKKKVHRRD